MDFVCDHVHLRSPDPEGTAQFYASMFGAAITSRVQNGAAMRVVVDLGGLSLFIEQVPATTHAPPAPPFLGIEHIGLRVADLDAAVVKLRAQGARFTKEPTSPRPGVKICFVQAPDGVQVEVLERSSVT